MSSEREPRGETVDIDALVGELRLEAAELRRRVGPSALGPLEPQREALAGVGADEFVAGAPVPDLGRGAPGTIALGAVRTAHLAALADPQDAAIHSHRARLGAMVVGVKKLLRRLLTPILDRQGAFNRAAIESLQELERATAAKLSELSRQMLSAEERLDRLTAFESPTEDGFDYRAFEDAFRGSREHVRAIQSSYLRYFPGAESGPVVDLGCGRGEFLQLLCAAGVPAFGVEREADLVATARAEGLDVRLGDALWALEAAGDRALGGVVAFQVIEHLPFWKVVRLVRLAREKLRPGGVLILETVNVESLVAWTRGWSLDPSHRQPVHPLTLKFVAERAGFGRSEIRYAGEVEAGTALEIGDEEDRETRNARRLNALVFGAQDYALVAFA